MDKFVKLGQDMVLLWSKYQAHVLGRYLEYTEAGLRSPH